MIESFTRKFNEVKHILKQKQFLLDKQLFTKSYKQIISFLKQFQNKKKKQWQQLTTYMVKLYFHEFYNIDQYNYNNQNSNNKSVFEISQTFSQSSDFYSKQSAAGKTSVTSSKMTITNNSIKSPSKLSQKLQRTFSEQSVTKSNLNGQLSQQSLRQSELSNQSEQSKSLKSIQTKFRNYVNALSTGNLQSANNQLKKSLKNKFQQEINFFQQRCKCIVDTIKFLNKKYSIQPPFTQTANLNQLQACIQYVSKKQKNYSKNNKQPLYIPKNLPQPTQDQSFSSKTQDTSSMQQLQQQLKKAQQLFNKKSVQQSMQRRKFQQLNKNCKKLQQEKKQLSQEIYKVKETLAKANKLNEVVNQKFSKLQIDLFKAMKEKEEMKSAAGRQSQKIQDQKQESKQSKEQESKQEKKCQKCEEYNHFLNDLIQTFKTMQQKFRTLQSQIQSKQSIIFQKLSTFQTTLHYLKPRLQQQFQQISFLSRKSQDLKNQSIQQALKINKLQKLQKLQSSILKIKQKITSQIKKCTKLYYHFQTSSVLGPCDKNQFETMVLQRMQNIMKQINAPEEQSTPFTRGSRFRNLEKQIKQTQFFNSNKIPLPIKQKNYLIKQIQTYANSIDRKSKPKTIKSFKLLYQFDVNIRANFHQYIDKRPNLLLILKLSTGAIIGGYSNQPLRKGIRSEQGFIFSLKLFQTYHLKQNYCMLYDDYYLSFGNSEIRIRVGQNIVYSNFGISNAHFDSNNTKFTMFLNTTCERELGFDNFEVYQVIYDEN